VLGCEPTQLLNDDDPATNGVRVLRDYQTDAELVSFAEIDSRLPELDDWEILLALHHHARSWDGLITTDDSMLNQALELGVLDQTKLHACRSRWHWAQQVKASGLLLAYLSRICDLTRPDTGQILQLKAGNIMPTEPEAALARVADHQNVDADELMARSRLDDATFARDPLAAPTLDG
jgi:hypothetical protein